MNLEIVRFDSSLTEAWDRFIENDSVNGTFLHTRKFYDHNPLNGQDDSSYLFYKRNKLIGVIPFNLIKNDGGQVLHSYLRSTYGGFIVSKYAGIEEINEMVKSVIATAKANGIAEIIIRNPFRIFNNRFCDESDYAMWLNGFSIKYRELEMAIQLCGKSKDELTYSDDTKRSLNKGQKTLVAQESVEYDKFWSILEKNLSDKYGAKPTHSYEQFLELLKHVGDEKIKLFVAKHGDEIIGGIVIFIVNKKNIHAQYIASNMAFQNHRPLNVIIDYIINWAYQNSFSYFNLGMANEENGRKINHGLFRFKEGFGATGVLRETMHLQLNNLEHG